MKMKILLVLIEKDKIFSPVKSVQSSPSIYTLALYICPGNQGSTFVLFRDGYHHPLPIETLSRRRESHNSPSQRPFWKGLYCDSSYKRKRQVRNINLLKLETVKKRQLFWFITQQLGFLHLAAVAFLWMVDAVETVLSIELYWVSVFWGCLK